MIARKKREIVDPFRLKDELWPGVQFYTEQRDIIYSVKNNVQTYVPAGNKLGKDFVTAFIVLWFFLTRYPCRIVTTSVTGHHLSVLWDEIRRFVRTSRHSLTDNPESKLIIKGGNKEPEITRIRHGKEDDISYIRGIVAGEHTAEALQGHHAAPESLADANDGVPRTLAVGDESSALRDLQHDMMITWAERQLWIGNTWDCHNFFRRDCEAGDLKDPDGDFYIRKVIKIRAEDSPNVRFALAEQAAGLPISNTIVVPGVKPYHVYRTDRLTLDKYKQQVILDAEFPSGDTINLVPKDWLISAAKRHAENIKAGLRNRAIACGCDPAEGGDNTSWAIVGEHGLIELISIKTTDTTKVVDKTVQIIRDYKLEPQNVVFDRGGGGHNHACTLRKMGYNVRTVDFGESVTPQPKPGMTTMKEQIENKEERSAYKNRRAEMYDTLRRMLNPDGPYKFAIPENILDKPRLDGGASLRRQILAVPLLYDAEGKMYLPTKRRKPGTERGETMTEICGCSPDELDSLVVSLFAMTKKPKKAVAGVVR